MAKPNPTIYNTERIFEEAKWLTNGNLRVIDNPSIGRYNLFKDNIIDEVLSEERLNHFINEHKDLVYPSVIKDNSNHLVLSLTKQENGVINAPNKKQHPRTYERLNILQNALGGCKLSGYNFYPKHGYCGWHTNSDSPGERIYLVYNQEDKKSFFRYKMVNICC